MQPINVIILIAAFLSIVFGLLFSFWPLVPAGIALLVFYGHTPLGVTAALFADLVFGSPVGLLAFIYFPFLLFAVLCVSLRAAALRFILPQGDPGTL